MPHDISPEEGTGFRSSPLVKIPAAAAAAATSGIPNLRTSLSGDSQSSHMRVVADDHPLAIPPKSASSAPSSSSGNSGVELSNRTPPPPALQIRSLDTPAPPVGTTPARTFSAPVKIVAAPASPPSKSLDDLADVFLSGPSERLERGLPPMLRPESMPATATTDLDKLRILVTKRAWGDVATLASQLLRGSNSHFAPIYSALVNNPNSALPVLESQQLDVVEIMTLCCVSWLKLRRYVELATEVDRWTFCHHVGGQAPTWVPWSLHILAASSMANAEQNRNDDSSKAAAIDALWAIRNDIDESDSSARMQVEHALTNMFLMRRDWRMALASLERMLELTDAFSTYQVESLVDKGQRSVAALVLQHAYQCELLSRQGRVLLQAGALPEAHVILERAAATWNALPPQAKEGTLSSHVAIQHVPAQLAANEGLLCFAYTQYDESLEFFRVSMQSMLASDDFDENTPYHRDDWVGPQTSLICTETRHELYASVMNNLSLCALYTCRLHESITVMEALVRFNPTYFLTSRVATNLCTLYELAADTSVSARQKRTLQKVAHRFFLHDIGNECFRLVNS
jgi:hypothetical protein